MTPRRVQLRRTKGWRKPPGAAGLQQLAGVLQRAETQQRPIVVEPCPSPLQRRRRADPRSPLGVCWATRTAEARNLVFPNASLPACGYGWLTARPAGRVEELEENASTGDGDHRRPGARASGPWPTAAARLEGVPSAEVFAAEEARAGFPLRAVRVQGAPGRRAGRVPGPPAFGPTPRRGSPGQQGTATHSRASHHSRTPHDWSSSDG